MAANVRWFELMQAFLIQHWAITSNFNGTLKFCEEYFGDQYYKTSGNLTAWSLNVEWAQNMEVFTIQSPVLQFNEVSNDAGLCYELVFKNSEKSVH